MIMYYMPHPKRSFLAQSMIQGVTNINMTINITAPVIHYITLTPV